jgi:glc operon protein GlcG
MSRSGEESMTRTANISRGLLAALLVGGGTAAPVGLTVSAALAAPAALAAQAEPQRITLGEAKAILAAAQADAARRSLQLSIAVVDGRGDLIAAVRMQDARPTTMDTAIGKAMSAAIFGRPSADLAGNATSPFYQDLNEATGGRLRFFQGAIPIVRDGYTVGAVGASGASSQDDEDAVRAALAAVGF